MEQSAKDMLNFCLDFIKINASIQSQNVQCRNWLKMAIDEIGKSNIDSSEFMISNLQEIDGYLTGHNQSATINTVFDKIEMIKTLLKT